MALRTASIDPASFSTIRFVSGALTLIAIGWARGRHSAAVGHEWRAGIIVAVYAVPFAYAYTRLTASTGALILFGCVQLTMIGAAIRAGERPRPIEWAGLAAAVAGLVVLVRPGLAAPSLSGALLMAVAGISWGLYSLLGRRAADALATTTRAFARACPMLVLVSVIALGSLHVERRGVLLAMLSGTVATGLGYVVWYTALPYLSAARAAIVQLAVPVLAAGAGVAFLSEPWQPRLTVATGLILGGIAVAVMGHTRSRAAEAAR
jgi:drug/metabolite transporter (DMT)-like permease